MDAIQPDHYGGKKDIYECRKVIKAWGLGFNLGNVLKYIKRHKNKGAVIEDLKKAVEYLQYEIEELEEKQSDSNRH